MPVSSRVVSALLTSMAFVGSIDAKPIMTVPLVVYSEDFEPPLPSLAQWSNTTTSTTPNGHGFLGRFNNQTVSLNLTGLPAHTSVTLDLDLYILNTWDGNFIADLVDIGVQGGPTLLRATFANNSLTQSYPDSYPGGSNPARTGAAANNTLGYTFGGDSVYDLSFTIPHSDSSIQFNFLTSTNSGVDNESMGLDNVMVTIEVLAEAGPVTLAPEPATIGLWAILILIVSALYYRRIR